MIGSLTVLHCGGSQTLTTERANTLTLATMSPLTARLAPAAMIFRWPSAGPSAGPLDVERGVFTHQAHQATAGRIIDEDVPANGKGRVARFKGLEVVLDLVSLRA